MANHFDEAWAVLSVSLLYKALQVLFQLHWRDGDTEMHLDVILAEVCYWIDLIDTTQQTFLHLFETQKM